MATIKENFSSLVDNAFGSLSRRIDNEIVGDAINAPYFPTNERPVVKTAANEQGMPKLAGTGSPLISQNTALLAAGAAGVGLIIWLAMR